MGSGSSITSSITTGAGSSYAICTGATGSSISAGEFTKVKAMTAKLAATAKPMKGLKLIDATFGAFQVVHQ